MHNTMRNNINRQINQISKKDIKERDVSAHRYELVSADQKQAVFEALMGNSPVAFVYIDLFGNVITCNPAFEVLFGYSLKELFDQDIDRFITTTELYEEAHSLTIRATHNSEILRMTSIRYHRNGTKVEVESQGMPVIVNGKNVGVLALYHDVTHLKNAERLANDLYASFKLLMDSIDADVYVSDLDTYEIIFMNKHMEDSFGSGQIGKKCYLLFRGLSSPCPHCTNALLTNSDGMPTGGVVWEGSNPITNKWYKNSDKAVYWNNNRLVRLQIATDISDIKEAEKKLEFMATHDALTKLPNRTLFQDRLEHNLKLSKRENLWFAVMFLDLDKFKQVNDTFGHQAGDQVLIETANRMKACIRDSDTIARVSGDEFTFLLERIQNETEVETIAKRVIDSVHLPIFFEGNQIQICASIGICFSRDAKSDLDTLINNADYAMYQAKGLGGNRFITFGNNMH
jgi:diguanylate cyclase (GGDEF)-like protein/PAS domain S-box-containing protein